MNKNEIRNELMGIQDELRDIVRRLKLVARETGDRAARGYCISEIEMAIGGEHGYLGGCQYTIQDMIDALEEDDERGEGGRR